MESTRCCPPFLTRSVPYSRHMVPLRWPAAIRSQHPPTSSRTWGVLRPPNISSGWFFPTFVFTSSARALYAILGGHPSVPARWVPLFYWLDGGISDCVRGVCQTPALPTGTTLSRGSPRWEDPVLIMTPSVGEKVTLVPRWYHSSRIPTKCLFFLSVSTGPAEGPCIWGVI